MDELLQYFISDTNKKHDAMEQRLGRIEDKLDDIYKFKITTIVSARFVSLVVSSICGLITMIATMIFGHYFK